MFGINHELLIYITGILALVTIALLVWLIVLQRTLKKIKSFQKNFLQSAAGANLEEMLMSHISEVRANREEIMILKKVQANIVKTLQSAFQKIGIVRFNAFDDLGGDQSFAVAMLNADRDGVVFSGIFGRNDMRVYAKPINDNKSSYSLSEEEQKAIEKANRK